MLIASLVAAASCSLASDPRISEIPGSPRMEFLAESRIAGTATDQSGLQGKDRSGVAENIFGSWGSGIEWEDTTTTDEQRKAGIVSGSLLAVCDRGPFDGASSFHCRVQRMQLTLTLPSEQGPGTLLLANTSTYLLQGYAVPADPTSVQQNSVPSVPLVGSLDALAPVLSPATWTVGEEGITKPIFPSRLDPESIRISKLRFGTNPSSIQWLVSDEYGPWIDAFSPVMVAATEGDADVGGSQAGPSAAGMAVHNARILLPERYRVKNPGATYDAEMPPANTTGRAPNRGLESLAISPSGTTIFTMTQSPLLQDNLLDGTRRAGINMRLLVIDFKKLHQGGAPREYVYQLSHRGNGINELLAWDDNTLLVLERCGSAGDKAKKRVVYAIDLAQLADKATDVSSIESLPKDELPRTITPLIKQPWLDLLDPPLGLKGPSMPEKIEGLARGPELPDGRGLLLVSVDNDLLPQQDNVVWAFAVGTPKAE
jgi:hypothetical protein